MSNPLPSDAVKDKPMDAGERTPTCDQRRFDGHVFVAGATRCQCGDARIEDVSPDARDGALEIDENRALASRSSAPSDDDGMFSTLIGMCESSDHHDWADRLRTLASSGGTQNLPMPSADACREFRLPANAGATSYPPLNYPPRAAPIEEARDEELVLKPQTPTTGLNAVSGAMKDLPLPPDFDASILYDDQHSAPPEQAPDADALIEAFETACLCVAAAMSAGFETDACSHLIAQRAAAMAALRARLRSPLEEPTGFTREDVANLKAMPDGTGYASIDDVAWFDSLIARIASLLPPETTNG